MEREPSARAGHAPRSRAPGGVLRFGLPFPAVEEFAPHRLRLFFVKRRTESERRDDRRVCDWPRLRHDGGVLDRIRRTALALALFVFGCATACTKADPDVLAVRKILPAADQELHLNQTVAVTFDRPIDPLSVTRDSIRLLDDAGRTIEAERVRVRGSTIEFVPRTPILASLEDGSYQPASRVTLELAGYPRPGTLRGRDGVALVHVARRSWRVVDAKARHAEGRMSFLPSLEAGVFRLESLPRVSSDGMRVELRFDRPVHPASILPSAFRIAESVTSLIPIPMRARAGGRGRYRGRVVLLELVRPIPETGALLWFREGHHGLLDYRLQPVLVPKDPTALPMQQFGTGLRIRRQPTLSSIDGVLESFDRRRLASREDDVDALGLPFEAEGRLLWARGGLRMPSLGWHAFRSMGDFRPPPSLRILRPGAEAEISAGETRLLPERVLDFDRFVIEEGVRVTLVVPSSGRTSIRVAGRFEIAGELILRLPTSAATPRPRRGDVQADPRALWQDIDGHVEFDVGGRVRVSGEIRSEGGGAGLAAGYLVHRSGFRAAGDFALQAWRAPIAAPGPALENNVPLPGRFVAVSPWYDVAHVPAWQGRSIASDAIDGLDIYVQTRRMLPSARRGTWTFVEQLREQGRLEALRFVVAARGHADGTQVLSRLEIR